MKFWDSSAIVPLLINEENTEYCIKVVAVHLINCTKTDNRTPRFRLHGQKYGIDEFLNFHYA